VAVTFALNQVFVDTGLIIAAFWIGVLAFVAGALANVRQLATSHGRFRAATCAVGLLSAVIAVRLSDDLVAIRGPTVMLQFMWTVYDVLTLGDQWGLIVGWVWQVALCAATGVPVALCFLALPKLWSLRAVMRAAPKRKLAVGIVSLIALGSPPTC
jgi:hypothetical protein